MDHRSVQHQEEKSKRFLTLNISKMITQFISEGRSHPNLSVKIRWHVLVKNLHGDENGCYHWGLAMDLWVCSALYWAVYG